MLRGSIRENEAMGRRTALLTGGILLIVAGSVVAVGLVMAADDDAPVEIATTIPSTAARVTSTSAAPAPTTSTTAATTTTTTLASTTSTTSVPTLRTFTVAATGDFLIHGRVIDQASTNGAGALYDFDPMLAEVKPLIEAADLAVCHIEVPLSADNSDLSGYPVFSAPHELADDIADAGYDSCSTVSNHALDRGIPGIQATLDALDRAGVRHAGSARSPEEAATPNVLDVRGVRVAHLAYAYGFNGFAPPTPWSVNQIDPTRILADARAARDAGAEFVFVSLQWGAEYQQVPTGDQQQLATTLLSSPDIDLIIGHHVHVVQPVGRVGGKVVAYGLGNFLSNQSPDAGLLPSTQDGVMLQLQVEESSPGVFTVTDTAFTPTFVDRDAGYVIRPVDPITNAASYERTVAAMTALGTEGVHPRP